MKYRILVAAYLLTWVSSATAAVVIADFNFNSGGTSTTDAEPLTVAGSLDASNVSGIVRALPLASPNIPGSGSFLTWGAADESGASDSFLFFDISFAPGAASVTYEQLTVDVFIGKTLGGAGATQYDYSLFSSIDGFTSPIDGLKVGPSIAGAGNQSATASITFDLSGLATQSTTTTFRLDPRLTTGSASNGNGTQRFGGVDNIALTGTVAVPEPSAFLSLSLLAVFFGGLKWSRLLGN